jgi:hypothetical protein
MTGTGPMRSDADRRPRSRAGWVLIALALTVLVVVAAAFLASGDPDGLERVAEDVGFLDAGQGSPFSVIADYVFPGLDGPTATIAAGVVGAAVLFAVVWLIGRMLSRSRG